MHSLAGMALTGKHIDHPVDWTRLEKQSHVCQAVYCRFINNDMKTSSVVAFTIFIPFTFATTVNIPIWVMYPDVLN